MKSHYITPLLLAIFIAFVIVASRLESKKEPLLTTASVNIKRYMGKWYEIASFPTTFQRGCQCTMAEYTYNAEGSYVEVVNKCKQGKKWQQIKGKAYTIEDSNNTKFKIQFFSFFTGDYWVLDLADNYSYALVGTPSRNYLWVLSRTTTLPYETYVCIVEHAASLGFDTDRLVLTQQDCS